MESVAASEWQQAGRRWRCACVRAAGTRPRAYWHEVEDRGGVGLGWLQCWAAQVRPRWVSLSLSLLYSVSVFYLFALF